MIREGIAGALGETLRRATVSEHTYPYSNADSDAATIRSALAAVEPAAPVSATFREISLIRIHRDRCMHE